MRDRRHRVHRALPARLRHAPPRAGPVAGPARYGPLHRAARDARRVAGRYSAARAQVALAWLLTRSPVTLAIPGTSSLAHLEENMRAAGLGLTVEDLAVLDALA
ncbi:aldo/keto reductase [Microbispora amethystogenes]|uniref:aldo/keto reductase n=1 Tax=Microbispora amethystogenes TaxID=1427754 RepID=UPI0031E503B0